jgi:hypothetical protein
VQQYAEREIERRQQEQVLAVDNMRQRLTVDTEEAPLTSRGGATGGGGCFTHGSDGRVTRNGNRSGNASTGGRETARLALRMQSQSPEL